jgi:hypothetical protein
MAVTGAYFAWRAYDQSIYDRCTVSIPEAASLAIKKGTPILIDSNGRASEPGTGPALIFGVALEDAHNGTAGQYNLLVARIRVGDVWTIPILETMAQNLFGVAAGDVGIVKDATTGLWYGSTADAGAQARIQENVAWPAGLNIGDAKWPAHVIFHSTKLQEL